MNAGWQGRPSYASPPVIDQTPRRERRAARAESSAAMDDFFAFGILPHYHTTPLN